MNSKQILPFLQPLFLIAVFTSQFASGQLGCPTNYIKIVDRCYYFSWTDTTGSDFVTFEEARDICQMSTLETYIYDLFVITDIEEFAVITAELNTGRMANGEYAVHVGAYNAGTNVNDWYWVDGAKLTGNDTLWYCHSPSSEYSAFLSYDRELTDCYTFGEWRLTDANSTKRAFFICEGPPFGSDISSDQLACNDGYTQRNDRCYYFSIFSDDQLRLPFDSARDICNLTSFESYTYDLLVISDVEEYAFITAELSHEAFSPTLIGAHNLGAGTPDWYWVDGTSLSQSDYLWQCYYPSSASNTAALLTYTSVYLPDCYTFGTFRLDEKSKSSSEQFICEGPAFPENVLKEAASYWKQLEEH